MKKALKQLMGDPDIALEARSLADMSISGDADRPLEGSRNLPTNETIPFRYIPLTMNGNSFQGSIATADLLREIGGGEVIRQITDLFYQKVFVDPHLDQFVASHDDPHHMRLGNWIVEKMGGEGKVWTKERATRHQEPVCLAGGRKHVVHDRSSAHVAAWYSTKRHTHVVGQHFNLQDSRIWMRLMFWSARQTGVFERSPSFCDWYIRFIGHFVRVYEEDAPGFARESARWSESEANIAEYLSNGNTMGEDVMGCDGMGVTRREARSQLPKDEAQDWQWPYEVKGQQH